VKKNLCVISLLALSFANAALAQNARPDKHALQQAAIEAKQQYVHAGSVEATTQCSYTFTSGPGNKFMKYCVTKNGNIVQFQSPKGVEYVATAPAGEGYAFCDFDSSTQYFDYAGYGDSGNWQAPTTVSKTATSVKISRKTSDGIYTLTQTITQNAANAQAQVTMALKNNTGTGRHIGLLRYVDVDANASTLNDFDYTFRTAFGYLNGGYGLQLMYVSGATSNGAFSQDIPGGPNSCQIFEHVQGPLQGVDGSVFVQYDFELQKNASQTVATAYKAF
jgi:hypothetical protein